MEKRAKREEMCKRTHTTKTDFKCSCPIDSGTRSIWVGLYWFMLIFHSLRSEFFVKRSNTKKWNEILFDLLWWRHLWFIPFLKQPSNVQWVNYASIDWIVWIPTKCVLTVGNCKNPFKVILAFFPLRAHEIRSSNIRNVKNLNNSNSSFSNDFLMFPFRMNSKSSEQMTAK